MFDHPRSGVPSYDPEQAGVPAKFNQTARRNGGSFTNFAAKLAGKGLFAGLRQKSNPLNNKVDKEIAGDNHVRR